MPEPKGVCYRDGMAIRVPPGCRRRFAVEQIISRLVRDFEDGKLTRRQLIQTLALGVAAGPVAMAVQGTSTAKSTIPPPGKPTNWKTVWLDHVSYQVSDYRRSTAFYRDLLGWEVLHDDGGKQCSMKIGNLGGIIIRNSSSYKGIFSDVQRGAANPGTGLINHISWGIEPWDTDKVKHELESRGLKPRPDMDGKFQSFHLLDPDGSDLQISNQKDVNLL
jgi:catechol 2,3-dioxygenase-like lactoylglutathione lyase family enzyme